MLSLLPAPEHADSLPAATARACLPHWLEAAGWAAALMSDATAAAMGRLPSTRREGVPMHALQWVGFLPAMTLSGNRDFPVPYTISGGWCCHASTARPGARTFPCTHCMG